MRRTRLARQPHTPRPLDWGNPLTKGLVASFYNSALDYAAPPVNYVGGQESTNAASGVTMQTSEMGVTPSFDGSSSGAKAKFDMSPLTKLTISFHLWWPNFTTGDDLALEYTSNYNSNNAFIVDANSGFGAMQFSLHSAGGYCSATIPWLSQPTRSQVFWHHYAWLIDLTLAASQTVAIYRDAVPQSLALSPDALGTGQTFTANEYLYFMCRNMASLFGEGSIAHVNIHNRLLSDYEVRALADNPRQIMLPTYRSSPMLAGAGGGVPAASTNRWFLIQ